MSTSIDMWVDKNIYWAWSGGPEGFCQPPFEKHLRYAEREDGSRVVCAVIENGVERELFRSEWEVRSLVSH